MADIAVLGYGVVGSGVVEVLETNGASIDKRAGERIRVKYVLDIRDFFGDPVQKIIVKDFNIILQDPSISVVVEVMGGLEPAYTFVKQSLLAGKSVVTSNKELVAVYGAELLAIAKEKKLNFLFEASVGGGIPIIRPLNQSLTADEIFEISGILNGTTNYILTKMAKEELSFDEALSLAQLNGYAERNPAADVEGFDSCRKIAILSSLAYGMQVDYEYINTCGIRNVTGTDIAYAAKLNSTIKLIATSRKINHMVYARVSPVIISDDHPLSIVNDVFNAIFIRGNVIGEIMFYGKGAGKLPTASAVVADIIDAVKHRMRNVITMWSTERMDLMEVDDAPARYLARIAYSDYNARLKEIEDIFGTVNVIDLDESDDEFAFITPEGRDSDINSKLDRINTLGRMLIEYSEGL